MAAWFGPDAEAPFDEVRQAVHEVLVAADMLMAHAHQPRQDPEFWRGLEGKVWKIRDDDESDSRVLAAVSQMERYCRPVLSTPPPGRSEVAGSAP
jgi:hypothetical protein